MLLWRLLNLVSGKFRLKAKVRAYARQGEFDTLLNNERGQPCASVIKTISVAA